MNSEMTMSEVRKLNDERVTNLVERSAVGGVTVWVAWDSMLERRFEAMAQSRDAIENAHVPYAMQYAGRDAHGYQWRVVLFKHSV